ncbi:MAG: DUF386 domain-containing protein [Spirochaetales bacterium]|nr:DUF386 domain-containing protein [Spirochaetales bacterium]
MLIDLLDNLEWYRVLHPQIQTVIDIMDRSLPYEDAPGQHSVDSLGYEVLSYVTSNEGIVHTAGEKELHVVLEGEELFSLQGERQPLVVTSFTTGSFVLVAKGETYRHRQVLATTGAVKKVIFRLPVLEP